MRSNSAWFGVRPDPRLQKTLIKNDLDRFHMSSMLHSILHIDKPVHRRPGLKSETWAPLI